MRERFYECLRDFSRSLSIALSSTRFIEQTPDAKIEKYHKDLAFFMNLRSSVRKRYAEVVDFREYEAKIQKLIDTHVSTGSVETVTSLVDIFDKDAFRQGTGEDRRGGLEGGHHCLPHAADHRRPDGRRPGVLPEVFRNAGGRLSRRSAKDDWLIAIILPRSKTSRRGSAHARRTTCRR